MGRLRSPKAALNMPDVNIKPGANRAPERVTLDLPQSQSGSHPRCASCGLLVAGVPHGTQQDCIDALKRELDALRKVAERS
jgi:hypothetical protein